VGATRFYDRQEIKDVLAYLKLIYNGRDSVSFNRIINMPRRGIGRTSLDRLTSYAEENDLTLLEAASHADRLRDLPPRAAGALKEFAYLVRSWQSSAGTAAAQEIGRVDGSGNKLANHALGILFAGNQSLAADDVAPPKSISVSELLQRVLRETRYLEKLAEDSDKDELAYGRIENVKELVAVAQEFDEIADEPDLDSFLTRISLVSDLDAVKLDQDAVKLMTVHSAKGLEFPVVFVMGLEEGLFPHIRSLDSPTAMEEERRLMYVAVTRAADLLYLTLARKRMIIGRSPGSQSNFSTTYTIPSQFLREITPGLLAGFYPAPAPASAPSPFPEYGSDESYESSSISASAGNGPPTGGYGAARKQDYPQPGFANAGVGAGYGASGRAKPRAMRMSSQPQNSEANRPTENLRERIDGRPPAPADNSFEHFTIGDVVQHARFGTGKVIQVIGEQDKEIYNVEFEEAGKRLLDPRFAKLVKLS
jgi:DNA helicase-2/ATP-dependent DNA helicase PcrA